MRCARWPRNRLAYWDDSSIGSRHFFPLTSSSFNLSQFLQSGFSDAKPALGIVVMKNFFPGMKSWDFGHGNHWNGVNSGRQLNRGAGRKLISQGIQNLTPYCQYRAPFSVKSRERN